MEDLRGRKIKGFKFLDNNGIAYVPREMDTFLNKTGTIVEVSYNCVGVEFEEADGKVWYYPIEEIEAFLITQDKVPVITDSFTLEVSDDEETWLKAEVIIVLDGSFITKDLIQWKYARNIQ